jgi:hypothetical protein
MLLMALELLALAWLATIIVVVALCVMAAQADRTAARTRRTPARSQLRLIA